MNDQKRSLVKREEQFDPKINYNNTRAKVGYVNRKESTQQTYDRIGFKSGLEVHQQLKTKGKLFCRCPSGIYNDNNDYDAELVRHMRPTLSELGEYDGTALMEFKTKKEIIYRINNDNACTYEVDDTPPFLLNREALKIAIEISLLAKLNIVGEVHITRKQYLDGSIPTGFQRTGIIGVEGEIQLRNKKVRLIQLSLEEDSCREISDVGHVRVFKTDRLGMPLIETVTYPDCKNPEEVREACDYIRFLNRSTGKVLTGIGTGRQDVNVSCRGGTRVEIKGVAHTKWIPELTHNECFRQWALLQIRDELGKRIDNPNKWQIKHISLGNSYSFNYTPIENAKQSKYKIIAVNLPEFKGLLSHFTQPTKMFADEISDRLKVIACIEKPNMTHSEELKPVVRKKIFDDIKKKLNAGENDAQIIFWGPDEDIHTALETIEERCKMAFDGVPNETRKSFEDGTTIFERVLPGADRMYPDTDTAPIPLETSYIKKLGERLPEDVHNRIMQMIDWKIPDDTYHYILSKNLFPIMKKIIKELNIDPSFAGTLFGQYLKFIEGHYNMGKGFNYKIIFELFKFLHEKGINYELIKRMLPIIYRRPDMDFDSILKYIDFRKIDKAQFISQIPSLKEKFDKIKINSSKENKVNWVMGELKPMAVGNIKLRELAKKIREMNTKTASDE